MRNRKEKIRFESSVASSQTVVDRKPPKNDGLARTDSFSLYGFPQNNSTQFDVIKQCSQNDDSTFPSLKLVRETSAKRDINFPEL